MLETIIDIFGFIKNWSDVFLIAVGFIAIWIYHLQKGNGVKAAATEVKEQILEIEDALQTFVDNPRDLTNNRMYLLGEILTENLWKKNRITLIHYLSEDDRKNIQKFYIFAERIERARLDVVKCLIDTWAQKSFLEQQSLCQYNIGQENNKEFHDRLDVFLQDENVFNPKMCIHILMTAKEFKQLVGTTTYKKLADLSNKPGWLIF